MARVVIPRVYAIVDRVSAGTDGVFLGHLAALLARLPADGRVWIQLRTKGAAPPVRRALLRESSMLLRAHPDAPVLVNGTSSEAEVLGFQGVHWPESKRPEQASPLHARLRWVCAAGHHPASFRAAQRVGAHVATFSPVFDARSKAAPGRGLDALREAVAASPVPILALGGVTPDNARSCIGAGAVGVAVLSPVSVPGADPAGAVSALLDAVGPRPSDPGAPPGPDHARPSPIPKRR